MALGFFLSVNGFVASLFVRRKLPALELPHLSEFCNRIADLVMRVRRVRWRPFPTAEEFLRKPFPRLSLPECPCPYLQKPDSFQAQLRVWRPPAGSIPGPACSFCSLQRRPWCRIDRRASANRTTA